MLERELKPVVARWLVALGYQVTCEFKVDGALCDIYAVKFAPRISRLIPGVQHGVAIELKVSDIRGVLKQASRNKWSASESFAAMPADVCDRMRPDTLVRFEREGVGLLRVDTDEVTVVVHSRFAGTLSHKFSRKLWRRIQRDRKLGRDYV